jgi:hypothetical protein
VKNTINQKLARCKRRIERRIDKKDLRGCDRPMMTARNIHYEIAGRNHGISHGGIGTMHTLANELGLIEAIDRRLHLLKIHLPYHESDHVLNIAYNALCGATRQQGAQHCPSRVICTLPVGGMGHLSLTDNRQFHISGT